MGIISGDLISPLTINGNFLQVPAGGGLDTIGAGGLFIGSANQTGITIGRGGQNVSIIAATLLIGGGVTIDSLSGGGMTIAATAASLTLGKGGTNNTTVSSGLVVSGSLFPEGGAIDRAGNNPLLIGNGNTTTITIGRVGQILSVPGTFNLAFAATAAGTGAAPTLPANTPTGATGGAGKWMAVQLNGALAYALLWQ